MGSRESRPDDAARRKALGEKIEALQATYDELNALYQPQIASLSAQADTLAQQFKLRFEQASSAYADGDRAAAKAISEEGHALQERCQQLNAEANALRWQLRSMIERLRSSRAERSSIAAELARRSVAATLRTRITRFEESGVLSAAEVRNLLSELPSALTRLIAAVVFVDRQIRMVSRSGEEFDAGGQTDDAETDQANIRIGRQLNWADVVSRRERLVHAILYEIGHVAYLHFLTDEDRANWNAWYQGETDWLSPYALQDDIEDFCEAFALYWTDPNALRRRKQGKFPKQRFAAMKEYWFRFEE